MFEVSLGSKDQKKPKLLLRRKTSCPQQGRSQLDAAWRGGLQMGVGKLQEEWKADKTEALRSAGILSLVTLDNVLCIKWIIHFSGKVD